MNKDLKIIKKKYGEEMMHLCRELFPTLLEQEGLLPKLLHDNFKESRSLVKDIIDNNLEEEFKNYIYNQVDVENNYEEVVSKRPEELLKEAGYKLYECHSEEEIQSFKKYYAEGEELCTFRGGRLNRCFVFFAIKENVDEIKRENFPKPQRQDKYGTSVISIQFTRDDSHTLSIKNRYNHTVNNPDSTFGNNLDNIIPGLTASFDKYYGMHQSHLQNSFEIPGYVRASDGKYYKYNYEINNIYYCENNVIIDNFEVKEYPKEQYVILDYFILDLKNKQIQTYWNDMEIEDSFPKTIGTIKDIKIENDKDNKNILIKTNDSDEVDVIITLDKNNRIITYKNNKVENISNSFLEHNNSLTSIKLPNAISIEDNFLSSNILLTSIKLPKVKSIGNRFLASNNSLTSIELPNATNIGNKFLEYNNSLTSIELPNATNIGNKFLEYNNSLISIELPNAKIIGDQFLYSNNSLTSVELPNAKIIGDMFLNLNRSLTSIELPNVTSIGDDFLQCNRSITSIKLPNAKSIGDNFLYKNYSLTSIELPSAEIVGYAFCQECSYGYIYKFKNMETVNIPLIPELEKKFKSNVKHI